MSPPERIDRYEILGVIGQGSMGVVYRARDPVIGRQIALKTVSVMGPGSAEGDTEPSARFAREARTAGLLSHPNIVTVYDAGSLSDPGSSYIAMELVEGKSLRQTVPLGESMPPDRLLEVAMQVARALDFAHGNGVFHRDVKPANILIRDDGLVKLADFGVARMESSDLTRTGESVGSPSYIAPEMLKDGGGDSRADLYSLGVVLYEMLTGQKPFKGDSLASLYHQILSVDHAPPSTHNPAVSTDWDCVIGRLLARDPALRYQKASQLMEDLRALERGAPPKFASHAPDGTVRILPIDLTDETMQIPAEVFASVEGQAWPKSWSLLKPGGRAPLALFGIAAFLVAVMGMTAALNSSPREKHSDEPQPVPATAPGSRVEASQAGPQPAAILQPEPLAAMMVRLDHNLKEGHFEITMDGDLVVSDVLPEAEKRGMRAMERRIEVPHGTHVFRVLISDHKGRSWMGVTTRDVGEERNSMVIELKGLLRRRLSVEWEPVEG